METKTLSSIRISVDLASKLELVAKIKGWSKTELVRRSLEAYLPQFLESSPQSADQVLDLLMRRSKRKPKMHLTAKEVFNENYQVEDL